MFYNYFVYIFNILTCFTFVVTSDSEDEEYYMNPNYDRDDLLRYQNYRDYRRFYDV